ncbi:MAG: Na/Pi cotransporter family protein [Clostridia bacterium]|nr:Na/Pi cotransporter family protein [Clostridia bacterium]
MDIFGVLSLIGGLALFLFGMDYMGAGLEKLAGGKLERILESMTNRPIKGVLLGLAVTAVIQSSSATTVMVVGFVNSGIMKLTQAVGIIMGANIGTTITAWVLSLQSIEGTSVIMKLLKPDSFSPIIAIVGVMITMFVKSGKKKDIASIMIGFAVLMYGMSAMSAAVKPLQDVPEFRNMLLLFENPVFGVLAGAIMTAIVQSSSAAVGILQAVSMTGSLSFGAALPILLGQNIGTCVTALISSIGAKKNAKRAAFVHLYFNIIGTVIFLIGFYVLHAIISFPFFGDAINNVNIAIVHTLFNVTATAILLPFNKHLCKLAELTVPDKAEEAETTHLDERFLSVPSFAIEQCKKEACKMAEIASSAMVKALHIVDNYNAEIAADIRAGEEKVDIFEDRLGSYLVKLSSKSLSDDDSHEVSKLLHNIGDLERISDHAVNIVEAAEELNDKGIKFTDSAKHELQIMMAALEEVLNITTEAFKTENTRIAADVEPLEEVIDHLKDDIRARHIERVQSGSCTIEHGFVFSDLLTNFERVSDHCSNIAVCIIRIKDSNLDAHEYLNSVRNDEAGSYNTNYELYKTKYALPQAKK